MPDAVLRFVSEFHDDLAGVVGVGNTTFGSYFCEGAKQLSVAVDVPLVTMIDLLPTKIQERAIKNFLEEDHEEVSRA